MRQTILSISLLSLLLLAHSQPDSFAGDYATRHIPEGAKARLGKGWINEIAYSPDGTRLAVATSIGIWLYDVATYQEVYLRLAHMFPVMSVAFSPDGETLATGNKDDSIRLLDAETGEQELIISGFMPDGHNGDVTSVAFSPDGSTLASGSEDHSVRLWDAETGEFKRTIQAHTSHVTSVVSPDGATLAIGIGEKTIRLWDGKTGVHKRTLQGHRADILTVAFSPDSATLATGCADATLRLWDVETGEHKRSLEGHTRGVLSLAFSPDGATLASGSRDGTVLLWELFPIPGTVSVEPPQVVEPSQVKSDVNEDGGVDPPQVVEPPQIKPDVNGNGGVDRPQVLEPPQIKPDVNEDGGVDVQDLVLVAARLGITVANLTDVNGDGAVNILDVVLVAGMVDNVSSTQLIYSDGTVIPRIADIKLWLEEARQLGLPEPILVRSIQFLRNLLAELTPQRTALLPNYPNPFNPETWIPYQLARDVGVQISIYSAQGVLVRQIRLGRQAHGFYTDKHHAAYWNGRNQGGEFVASGVYFYTLKAGEYTATRKMLIRK